MDIKQKLLLFLYDNRSQHRRIKFNEVFVDCELRPVDVRYLLLDLLNNKIIDLHPDYFALGNREAGVLNDFHNSHLEGKLTPIVGEQYVKDNYLSKNEPIPTIHADNVVYNTGNITAPVSQADNQSSSSNQTIKRDIKKPTTTVTTIAKYILAPLFVAVVGGLIVWYLTTTNSNNNSASPTTSDTTATQKHDTILGK